MLGLLSPRIFLGRAQRQLMRRGLPILTYHKIDVPPSGSRDPFLYVCPSDFDAQLRALKESGYRSCSLDAFKQQPEEAGSQIVVTFDDGFRNVLKNGAHPLANHQIRAIQFIVADAIGGINTWDVEKGDRPEPLLDEGEIREWLSLGHEIGSHSVSHRNLKKLSASEAREEIFGSKRRLEDKFGVAIRHFCYPFGGYNEQARDLVKEAGYATASTVQFGVNESGTSPFELKRIIPLSGIAMLRKICHRGLKKLLVK